MLTEVTGLIQKPLGKVCLVLHRCELMATKVPLILPSLVPAELALSPALRSGFPCAQCTGGCLGFVFLLWAVRHSLFTLRKLGNSF